MSAAIKLEKVCATCAKRDTGRCCVYKEDGKRPGLGDWCNGYKPKIERKVA